MKITDKLCVFNVSDPWERSWKLNEGNSHFKGVRNDQIINKKIAFVHTAVLYVDVFRG